MLFDPCGEDLNAGGKLGTEAAMEELGGVEGGEIGEQLCGERVGGVQGVVPTLQGSRWSKGRVRGRAAWRRPCRHSGGQG